MESNEQKPGHGHDDDSDNGGNNGDGNSGGKDECSQYTSTLPEEFRTAKSLAGKMIDKAEFDGIGATVKKVSGDWVYADLQSEKNIWFKPECFVAENPHALHVMVWRVTN